MKKKVLWMTAIGLLLLGAVIAAALNAVFTVTDVVADFSVYSAEGMADAERLQTDLEARFIGKSTTFLDLADAKEAAKAYPALRVEVKKELPRTLRLTVEERRERYAVAHEGGFSVLDEEGVYLYEKETNTSRLGGENLLLVGFTVRCTAGERAEGKGLREAMTFVSALARSLSDVRANVLSVTFAPTEIAALQGEYYFRVAMREGVTALVYQPGNYTEEKAAAVLDSYRSLSDEQRMYGYFDIVDLVEGGFMPGVHRAEEIVS